MPIGPLWIFEPKLDGWRLQVIKEGLRVRLLTRRRADYTSRLPTIAAAVLRLPVERLVLDGELCAVKPGGRIDFYGLQGAMRASSHDGSGLLFFAFDCLWIGDHDLRRLALRERRRQLEAAVPRARQSPLLRIDQYRDGQALFSACSADELEGVVAKRLDRPYTSGPTRDWLKVKCEAWKVANAERWRMLEKG